MIPFEIALLGYIPLAALIMFDRNRARGFTVAVLLGMLFLPSGVEFELPGVPDLEKNSVTFLGILLGTILFHPKSFDEFRVHPTDLLLIGMIQATILTSVVEQYGMRDGAVRSVQFMLAYCLPILLARLHLNTPTALRTFLIGIVVGACIYAPLAAFEWRVSPKINLMLYGYFQHDFKQFMRNGFFRPVVCFTDALRLGQYFAFAAFLALLPMRRDLVKLFGGWGRYVFLVPLAGVVLSMSWGPQMLFVFLCALYIAFTRQPWIMFALPMFMFLWLIGLFFGFEFGMDVVKDVENVNAARAQSLGYRFNAMVRYKDLIMEKPFFGWGGAGRGYIEKLAMDSQAIVLLMDRGWAGLVLLFGWLTSGMYIAMRVATLVPDTALERRMRAIAALISMWLAIMIIDGALEPYGICLLASAMSIRVWLETQNTNEQGSASSALDRALPTAVRTARQKG